MVILRIHKKSMNIDIKLLYKLSLVYLLHRIGGIMGIGGGGGNLYFT